MIIIELSAYFTIKKLKNSKQKGETNKQKKPSIATYLEKRLIDLSEINTANDYMSILKDQWNYNTFNNLKHVYDSKLLIGYKNLDGIEGYVFKDNLMQDQKQIASKLIILTEKDDVDDAINIFYKNLANELKDIKVRFSLNKKVKVYLPKDDDDIVDEFSYFKPYISVELKKKQIIDKLSIAKNIVVLLAGIICIIFSIIKNSNDVLKNVLYGITASIGFSLILEIVNKMIELTNNRYTISIKNISTLIYDQARNRKMPIGNEEEIDSLDDPDETSNENEFIDPE